MANATKENDKIKQLEQDLVNERERCSQLEEDISILIRGRDAELIELNQTIASLKNTIKSSEALNESLAQVIVRINTQKPGSDSKESAVNICKPVKEHSREANLSGVSILLENSIVSREQALPVARQAEINNEIPLSVSPPENDNATSDLGNNKSETQSIEQFKPTTITAATTNAIHTKGEKNRAGQNKTIRNKGKFGNKVNNDNDNSSTHSLKPKQKGEIKINKNNTPPISNNHREIL
jgi:hypothetical protein